MKDEIIQWVDCQAGNWDTYPTKRGQYLLKYKDGDLSFYMISYFHPKGSEHPGFYFDDNCKMEAEIESKWGFKPYQWAFLPNLLRENGEY